MNDLELLEQVADNQPYPLLFATISGAHLYGFPSPDSDYDLRGVHVLPLREIIGLSPGPQTIEVSDTLRDAEIDLVTHEVRKFFGLLLKPNGYVLEQLYSPLMVRTGPLHEELKAIARGCITRRHARHYLGFAQTQWRLFEKERPHRIKPLLYVYRVLLTGIHLMRTGEIEANLTQLNEVAGLPYIPDLVTRKLQGSEHAILDNADMAFHQGEFESLCRELQEAAQKSALPEATASGPALNNLLIRIRESGEDGAVASVPPVAL